LNLGLIVVVRLDELTDLLDQRSDAGKDGPLGRLVSDQFEPERHRVHTGSIEGGVVYMRTIALRQPSFGIDEIVDALVVHD